MRSQIHIRAWFKLIRRLSLLVCALGCTDASASVFGSFDVDRGGIDAIFDANGSDVTRALIETIAPSSTFTSTPTLTSAYLSTIDSLFLGPWFWFNSAVTPLSPAEQSALLQFVKNGGSAFIAVGPSLSFNTNTVDSFLAPFGMHSSGTGYYDTGATVVDATHPVTDGAYGPVNRFPTASHGVFDTLGPATSLAVGNGNNQPILAVIDRSALSPGSGPVVLLGDINIPGFASSSVDVLSLVENTIHFLVSPIVNYGDANSDNVTDGADYVAWADHFLQTTAQGPFDGDFARDGVVDGADYVVWADHFAPSTPSLAAVPEPSTLALATIGGLALLVFARRRRSI